MDSSSPAYYQQFFLNFLEPLSPHQGDSLTAAIHRILLMCCRLCGVVRLTLFCECCIMLRPGLGCLTSHVILKRNLIHYL